MKDSLDPHFSFLYQQLKDYYTEYSYYVFSTTSAILLMIGWLLTSTDARTYISQHARIKLPMFLTILFFLLAEIYFSCSVLRKSNQTVGLLREAVAASKDKLITDLYYLPQVVPVRGIVAFVTAHAVQYAILVLIICS